MRTTTATAIVFAAVLFGAAPAFATRPTTTSTIAVGTTTPFTPHPSVTRTLPEEEEPTTTTEPVEEPDLAPEVVTALPTYTG